MKSIKLKKNMQIDLRQRDKSPHSHGGTDSGTSYSLISEKKWTGTKNWVLLYAKLFPSTVNFAS